KQVHAQQWVTLKQFLSDSAERLGIKILVLPPEMKVARVMLDGVEPGEAQSLFVQARDLLCKIAGETDPARMEVNAWEAMELSRKMRAAEPPFARLLIECAEAMEENCEHEGKLSTFVDLA